jgi:peptidoglycan/xylan/chitin deacetylase (PgdA/CDA1 family)
MAHPDLFDIENHGENHVPAIDLPVSVYGIAAAGSSEAVAQEVNGGKNAIIAATGNSPRWFRGATAKYTTSSMAEINRLGERVAGYSINGDGGSLLGASVAAKRIASAGDGDVIIAHINQPTHEAGEGVARGLKALKARGVVFVRLSDPGFDAKTD